MDNDGFIRASTNFSGWDPSAIFGNPVTSFNDPNIREDCLPNTSNPALSLIEDTKNVFGADDDDDDGDMLDDSLRGQVDDSAQLVGNAHDMMEHTFADEGGDESGLEDSLDGKNGKRIIYPDISNENGREIGDSATGEAFDVATESLAQREGGDYSETTYPFECGAAVERGGVTEEKHETREVQKKKSLHPEAAALVIQRVHRGQRGRQEAGRLQLLRERERLRSRQQRQQVSMKRSVSGLSEDHNAVSSPSLTLPKAVPAMDYGVMVSLYQPINLIYAEGEGKARLIGEIDGDFGNDSLDWVSPSTLGSTSPPAPDSGSAGTFPVAVTTRPERSPPNLVAGVTVHKIKRKILSSVPAPVVGLSAQTPVLLSRPHLNLSPASGCGKGHEQGSRKGPTGDVDHPEGVQYRSGIGAEEVRGLRGDKAGSQKDSKPLLSTQGSIPQLQMCPPSMSTADGSAGGSHVVMETSSIVGTRSGIRNRGEKIAASTPSDINPTSKFNALSQISGREPTQASRTDHGTSYGDILADISDIGRLLNPVFEEGEDDEVAHMHERFDYTGEETEHDEDGDDDENMIAYSAVVRKYQLLSSGINGGRARFGGEYTNRDFDDMVDDSLDGGNEKMRIANVLRGQHDAVRQQGAGEGISFGYEGNLGSPGPPRVQGPSVPSHYASKMASSSVKREVVLQAGVDDDAWADAMIRRAVPVNGANGAKGTLGGASPRGISGELTIAAPASAPFNAAPKLPLEKASPPQQSRPIKIRTGGKIPLTPSVLDAYDDEQGHPLSTARTAMSSNASTTTNTPRKAKPSIRDLVLLSPGEGESECGQGSARGGGGYGDLYTRAQQRRVEGSHHDMGQNVRSGPSDFKTKINEEEHVELDREHALGSNAKGHGHRMAGQPQATYHQMKAHTHTRQQERRTAAIIIQRLCRGYICRRQLKSKRKFLFDSFKCMNCKKVQQSGFYCTGCGRKRTERAESVGKQPRSQVGKKERLERGHCAGHRETRAENLQIEVGKASEVAGAHLKRRNSGDRDYVMEEKESESRERGFHMDQGGAQQSGGGDGGRRGSMLRQGVDDRRVDVISDRRGNPMDKARGGQERGARGMEDPHRIKATPRPLSVGSAKGGQEMSGVRPELRMRRHADGLGQDDEGSAGARGVNRATEKALMRRSLEQQAEEERRLLAEIEELEDRQRRKLQELLRPPSTVKHGDRQAEAAKVVVPIGGLLPLKQRATDGKTPRKEEGSGMGSEKQQSNHDGVSGVDDAAKPRNMRKQGRPVVEKEKLAFKAGAKDFKLKPVAALREKRLTKKDPQPLPDPNVHTDARLLGRQDHEQLVQEWQQASHHGARAGEEASYVSALTQCQDEDETYVSPTKAKGYLQEYQKRQPRTKAGRGGRPKDEGDNFSAISSYSDGVVIKKGVAADGGGGVAGAGRWREDKSVSLPPLALPSLPSGQRQSHSSKSRDRMRVREAEHEGVECSSMIRGADCGDRTSAMSAPPLLRDDPQKFRLPAPVRVSHDYGERPQKKMMKAK